MRLRDLKPGQFVAIPAVRILYKTEGRGKHLSEFFKFCEENDIWSLDGTQGGGPDFGYADFPLEHAEKISEFWRQQGLKDMGDESADS